MKHAVLTGILTALLLTAPLPAFSADTSGMYHTLQWSLEQHVLTVTGTGSITQFPDVELLPWQPYAADIFEIVIGEGITAAEEHVFSGYPHLQHITLPSTFTSLAPYALSDNPELSVIDGLSYVTDFNFHCLSGTAYIAAHPYIVTNDRLYYVEYSGDPTLDIPDGVTEIMPFAFGNFIDNQFMPSSENAVSVSVNLPDSVTSIREHAFAFCAGLQTVHLPDNLQTIGDRAFFDCANLKSLTLGKQVESVGEQAFYNCRSMDSLTVRNPDTRFGSNAYGDCYDWYAAITERQSNENRYESLLAMLQTSPCAPDEAMAVFALHFLDTCKYEAISFKNDYEEFQQKHGTIIGYPQSSAKQFADANNIRFETIDILPGDVTLDGILDILDVIALNKHLLGVSELSPRARIAADFNADSRIEARDSIAVLQCILGKPA